MTESNDIETKAKPSNDKASSSDSLSSDQLFKKATPKTNTENTNADEIDSSKLEAEIAKLKEEHTAALQAQKIQYFADLENARKIHKREEEKARNFGIQKLATDLLNIADALHQGINNCPEEHKQGLSMILQVFDKTLHNHDIEAIAPNKGDAYNHHIHEAMVNHPTDEVPNNHIVDVIQNGYKLKERLLRPARVVVAKNTEKSEEK